MEKHIQDAMNSTIIEKAAVEYGVSPESIKRVGGFENFIYEFNKDDQDIIIRFVHSVHRSYEFVYAELEFIDYLSKSGANVSTMIPNLNGDLLFKIETENNEYFTVSTFTKAPGTYVKREAIDDDFIFMFGKAVGKLHALTKQYKPKHKRYHWHEEDYIDIGKRNLPNDMKFIIDMAIDHTNKMKEYKVSNEDYGLIHTDLHFGNMYYDGVTLTFFDWDDASYKHFISDIAIIVFYYFGMGKLSDEEIEDKTIHFLKHFIKGYETENFLDHKWYKELNEFFKLRELILVMVIYAAGDEMVNGPWGKNFLDKYVNKLKNNIPFFNIERVLKGLWNS